jgi:hypothetical protein
MVLLAPLAAAVDSLPPGALLLPPCDGNFFSCDGDFFSAVFADNDDDDAEGAFVTGCVRSAGVLEFV